MLFFYSTQHKVCPPKVYLFHLHSTHPSVLFSILSCKYNTLIDIVYVQTERRRFFVYYHCFAYIYTQFVENSFPKVPKKHMRSRKALGRERIEIELQRYTQYDCSINTTDFHDLCFYITRGDSLSTLGPFLIHLVIHK